MAPHREAGRRHSRRATRSRLFQKRHRGAGYRTARKQGERAILRLPFKDGTKCFLFAWVPAWGAGLFLAAAALAQIGLVAGWTSCGFACTFPVADAIPPLAKLVFGAALGALMWLSRQRRPATRVGLMLRDAASGAGAALLVFAVLPGGFGLAYTDLSGWTAPAAIHIFAGALGALLGTLLEASCRQRMMSD